MRILLLEDEMKLGEAVRTHLRRNGHAVDWLSAIEDARAAVSAVSYELALLDLHLPDGFGLDFLKELRTDGWSAPIIVLTARDQVRDRIAGLNSGADDYLVKPFDLDELTARIAAVERRVAQQQQPLTSGGLEIDQTAKRVRKDGETIDLTSREWALISILARRRGATLSKAQIEEALYPFGEELESNAVEVYVSRLRKKLGASAILTVRGVGYRLASEL